MIALGLALAGCTLLVSTSGLHDDSAIATAPDGGTADISVASDGAVSNPVTPEGGADAATSELPGLIGAWLFDDGTTSDSSGKGNHGTLTENAVVGDTTRGKALVLNGSGFLRVNALDGAAFPKSGTFSIWFRWTDMNVADTHVLLDAWDPNRRHIILRHANDAPVGEFQFALQTRDTRYIAEGYAEAPKDAWQHVVISWDATQQVAVLYQNGKLVSRDDYEADFVPNEQDITIGNYLRGAIDDVRLYDRALTEAEAIALP